MGGHTAFRRDRCRVCSLESRCHFHVGNPANCCGKAGNIGNPARVRAGRRSVGLWPGRVTRTTGGNITGLSNQTADIAGKRVELLRELAGQLRRLAIMVKSDNASAASEMREVKAAAGALGIEAVPFEIGQAGDIGPAFEALKGRADALYVVIDSLVTTHANRINTLALGARLPTMHGARELVAAGGLVSYAAAYEDLYRRGAEYIDKILRGTKPADIPIEQPTKFDLVLNLTTAKVLGLTIREAFLLRADEVIE
ncbi:MAG: ABC transporter substrate-binding protein [Pseudolabrys sp.]